MRSEVGPGLSEGWGIAVSIRRGPESFPGRTRRVDYGGLVHCVMSAPDKTDTMAGQTRQCLDGLDLLLAEAGSEKSKLVTATVYLSDMALKSEMKRRLGRLGRSCESVRPRLHRRHLRASR